MITLRPYQSDGLNAVWNYFANGGIGNPVLAWPTGCHAKNTKILMYDGSLKNVEDILINDELMGPDSQSRKVISLARGKETMIKINPIKGESFIVNLNHILALKSTSDQHKRIKGLGKGNKCNISIKSYINTSNWFKHTHKLWRTGVEFSNSPEMYLTPYALGIFLGDGSYMTSDVNITSADPEILNYFENEALAKGDKIRINNSGSKANCLHIRRSIKNWKYRSEIAIILDYLGLRGKSSENKFVPQDYKTSCRIDRLHLLAGLIDTDGSLVQSGGYDYISKSKQLAEDVTFIARSLGFAAYCKSCKKSDQNGTISNYFRVSIFGNVNEIPVLLDRKKANERIQKKDNLVTGFTINILPEDNYYGFELDKDHLYLTSDFTVHHNTGKSIVPAEFIHKTMSRWPNQRFLMITHVKELIAQNAEVMHEVWPNAPMGIYSAGLGHKQSAMPIVFGGIQSMVKHPQLFGHRDIVFIDEAHLVSQDDSSMYLSFLATMKLINPNLKIVGMSATPFRMGQGLITDEGLFTDIVHDLTGVDAFNEMIDQGYMVPLVPRRTRTELDVSNVGMSKGEFIGTQLQGAVDKNEITYAGLRELTEAAHDRRSWLIFASGIEHAEHIAEMLQSFGVDCAPVHSKRSSDYNDQAIRAFKNNELRSIVNYSKLTTGFNHPHIDCIADFRPTMSIPLHIQKLGRGTRPANGKTNCLVLDFSRNVPRLGPINDPIIPKKKGSAAGDIPVKICEACGTYNHLKVRFCTACGNEFQFQIKIVPKSGNHEIIRSDQPIIETFDVDRAIYTKHQKDGKPPYIKVTYFCGMQAFNEFVFPESAKAFGRHKFHQWFMQRNPAPPPNTASETLEYISQLRTPKRIKVWVNRKWAEVMSAEF